MLLKNFKVVDHRILNIITKNLFSAVLFSNSTSHNGRFSGWPKYNIRLTAEQYKKKLKQCPKLSHEQLCCKKLFSKAKPKHEVTTASDEYLKARHSLKLRIEEAIKYVESESQVTINDLKNYLEKSKADRAVQLEELFKQTTQELDKLIRLDVSYGNWMRKETLLLNDEIRRSFESLERVIAPHVKLIESMLKSLRSDVTNCARRAEKSIVACRKHDAPSKFAKCVKERFDEAMNTLDQAIEKARLKLQEIVRFREKVLKAHRITMEEVTEVNREKAAKMSRYLKKCIVELKKSKK